MNLALLINRLCDLAVWQEFLLILGFIKGCSHLFRYYNFVLGLLIGSNGIHDVQGFCCGKAMETKVTEEYTAIFYKNAMRRQWTVLVIMHGAKNSLTQGEHLDTSLNP